MIADFTKNRTIFAKTDGSYILIVLSWKLKNWGSALWKVFLWKKKKKIGQNVIDKLTKWGKIGFFMEYFRTDFSQFSSAAVKVFILGGRMNTCL